ncbi:hypothetical protein B296_00003241 [Ensete ventricosum]|uniref:Uncharacterized protein n=1 Tax=Ensete ventricosum TaxID=4639 RepID=A0A427AWX5_ENSVE|nr:hypothetical protein B296_00003241 [Ensete ventricosum]
MFAIPASSDHQPSLLPVTGRCLLLFPITFVTTKPSSVAAASAIAKPSSIAPAPATGQPSSSPPLLPLSQSCPLPPRSPRRTLFLPCRCYLLLLHTIAIGHLLATPNANVLTASPHRLSLSFLDHTKPPLAALATTLLYSSLCHLLICRWLALGSGTTLADVVFLSSLICRRPPLFLTCFPLPQPSWLLPLPSPFSSPPLDIIAIFAVPSSSLCYCCLLAALATAMPPSTNVVSLPHRCSPNRHLPFLLFNRSLSRLCHRHYPLATLVAHLLLHSRSQPCPPLPLRSLAAAFPSSVTEITLSHITRCYSLLPL